MKVGQGGLSIIQAGLLAAMLFAGGCATGTENFIAGALGTTAVGGTSPSHQLEQVYYLGVFDPQEQLPPTIYRIIVRGQAAALSTMDFGSGWAPAELVDSLSSSIGIKKGEHVASFNSGAEDHLSHLTTGRRLMMFGPEGFREAPKYHRLVVVMGSNAQGYFSAMDEVLGDVAQLQDTRRHTELKETLMRELIRIQNEKNRLKDADNNVQLTFAN